ncbi:two-component regulator propeller domain-containing protein [Carboxylicivirga linearis]|uniref:Helix-turn-helix domain-containing protein n=1 Tax=Carboxylicivirga linearis TaxID=1628157 RepID=A0ABS5JUY1_9BACT|nr:two-component regulator propeller domain-containing protein [Carboxylicivirga linearis]MBS2098700.1 helix-turn-helix domain-containing protein [Carboxylicivirga linearis]
MNIGYSRILFALLILFLPYGLRAQINSFKKIRVEDGLSSNYIKSVHIDEFGYVWLATLEGLDRFDGVTIRSFSEKFPTNKVSINCFANDPDKGIWFGSDDQLFYWDFINPFFESYQIVTNENKIKCLISSPADTSIYIGTSKGVSKINVQTKAIQQVVNEGVITSTYLSADKTKLYIASLDKGLIEYDIARNTTGYYATNNFGGGLVAITGYLENLVLATDTKQLFLFDTDSKKITELPVIVNDYILTLTFDLVNNNLCIGTDGGGLILYNIDSKTSKLISHDSSNPSSLSSNSIYSVLVDADGRFWIGSYAAGLNYSNRINGSIKVSSKVGELFIGQQSIRSFYFGKHNLKMIGTRDGLFVSNPDKGISKFYRKDDVDALRSDIILSFYPLTENNILVGTYGGGISLYDVASDELINYRTEKDFLSGAIYGIVKDANNVRWILSLNGLYKIDGSGEAQVFTESNSDIISNQLYAGYIDSKNRLWLGSMIGTAIYDISTGIPKRIVTAIGLPLDKTVAFFEDSKSNIWVSTEKGGLDQVSSDLNKIQAYKQTDGLVNNSISSVAESPEGVLWVATLKGLSRFDVEHKVFQSYSLSDGLPGLAFNPNAVMNSISEDGQLWFGNEKGLVHFQPDSLIKDPIRKKVLITDIFVNGNRFIASDEKGAKEPVEELSYLNLKGAENNLGFRFVALNYYAQSDNVYLYRLKGEDDNWKVLKGDNQVFYQSLKAGKYVFEVCLAKGNESPDLNTIRQLKVTISPVFYRNPFWQAVIVLAVLLIILWMGYNIKKGKPKEKEETKKYESSRLTSEKSQAMLEKISQFIIQKELYLNVDLKIADLAKELGCSSNEISQSINQNLHITFNEFINGFRVKKVIELMGNPEYSKFTLVALAQNCGFNSKTSFYRIFKKETGYTPAEYHKRFISKEDL